MLTRSLYLAAGWFIISFIGLLLGGTRLRQRSMFLSIAWLAFVIMIGDGWAILTFGIPEEILRLSIIAAVAGLAVILILKSWNAFGQVVWLMSILVTILFISYSFSITAFTPLNPLSFLFAVFFFFIETIALLLALTHAYESLDATTRLVWHRRVPGLLPIAGYAPKVSLHVPTYNEPPEVVRRTLQSLANLDYPNYEVLVVDNNTPDERIWRSLETIVQQMGPRFRYLHLDKWPGYKSGALNFALAQTAPDAEIIGTIDADYQLNPNYLSELVPAFLDPKMAFVQTPQDYRDYKGSTYTEATYYGYKYFFEVSMPTRNESNAIIFAGTMGLIRKSVLQEIGGWDEWCITEDAEASLRILKRGYRSLYINKTYGQGLMPFDFDGLKKQRFRWCFGGIQILRKHWEALMPWARWVDPDNKLTPAQRYYYLVGGLQWYTDVLNLFFAFFLVLGALFVVFNARGFVIRPLTGPLLTLPAIFLVLNMWRFLWVLRRKLNLDWRMAIITMYNFFSLGWVVSLASIQGLIQPVGVFLRTPKSKSQSKVWHAIQSTRWEAGIGTACLAAGVAAFITHPAIQTFVLGILLIWQAGLYMAAPAYSLLSLGAPGPRPVPEVPPRPTVQESWAARFAMASALGLVAVAVLIQFAPHPSGRPFYSRLQPPDVPVPRLFGLQQVPINQRAVNPTPEPALPVTGGKATRTPRPTEAPGSTPAPSGTPLLTGTTSPTSSPSVTPSPTETSAPPTSTSTTAPPTATLTGTAPPTATSTTSLPTSTSTTAPPTSPPQPPRAWSAGAASPMKPRSRPAAPHCRRSPTRSRCNRQLPSPQISTLCSPRMNAVSP
jgi:cellulose synthase/poly-beta-1,6-N-acetylglucosamine synthase-like glycosyltransferase